MRIRIKALDTLFFRDGKPFGMDEATWATGIFPPPPSVFYGALRSLYFSLNPDKIPLAGTENDPTQELQIKSILMGKNKNEIYYPCPADFVVEKTEKTNKDFFLLNLKKETDGVVTNQLFKEYTIDRPLKQIESLQGSHVMTERNLRKYTAGSEPTSVLSSQSFFFIEPKVGIGRSNTTHTTDEGKLYRVGMLRPVGDDDKHIDFWIEFNLEGFDLSQAKKGFLKLGGEGKVVEYELAETLDADVFPELDDKFFKIVLLSPAIFQNTKFEKDKVHGWLPEFIGNDFTGQWNGVHVKLIGACLGKHQNIGGFNMQPHPHPKTMHKAVPVGSVYFFQIIGEKTDFMEKKQFFHFSNHRSNEGFGLAILANTKQIKL